MESNLRTEEEKFYDNMEKYFKHLVFKDLADISTRWTTKTLDHVLLLKS